MTKPIWQSSSSHKDYNGNRFDMVQPLDYTNAYMLDQTANKNQKTPASPQSDTAHLPPSGQSRQKQQPFRHMSHLSYNILSLAISFLQCADTTLYSYSTTDSTKIACRTAERTLRCFLGKKREANGKPAHQNS